MKGGVYSLRTGLFVIQDLSVEILCEETAYSLVSNYFESICYRKINRKMKPLRLELHILDEPPSIPSDSVRGIQGPSVTTHARGNDIYLASLDGSLIHLDTVERKSKAYLKEAILTDTEKFFSLLGQLLVEALRYNDLHFLHAAALHSNGLGLLFSGDGGCGKTTNSLGLIQSGFHFVSDDSIFLENKDGKVIVHPLYKAFHIDRDVSRRFPELTEGTNHCIPPDNKLAIDVSQIYSGRFISTMTPNIIIFPKITFDAKSDIYPLTQIEVYSRLLTQIILAPQKTIVKKHLKLLEKLVTQTTGFELMTGKDVYEDPSKLIELICYL